MKRQIRRRAFLRRTLYSALTIVGFTPLVAACKAEAEAPKPEPTPTPAAPTKEPAKPAASGESEPAPALAESGGSGAAVDCTDVASLKEQEKTVRTALQYVDKSVESGKSCDGCSQFTAASGKCGSCKVVPGPINPKGYCASYTARA